MADTNSTNPLTRYVDYINVNILPFIDYDKLQKSYATDTAYAKGVLNCLHGAMVKIYGSEYLDWRTSEDGFVMIPGIVQGRENGNICLALLDLDLTSSCEHWGTTFLCKYGAISQSDIGESPAADAITKHIGTYDYCYTALTHDDHHVDFETLPSKLKAVLADFERYKMVSKPKEPLRFRAVGSATKAKKPSVLDELRDDAKAAKSGSTKDASTANKSEKTKKKYEPEL